MLFFVFDVVGVGIFGSLEKMRIRPLMVCNDRTGEVFANGQEFVKYAQNSHFACSAVAEPLILAQSPTLLCRLKFMNPRIWL